MSLDSALNFVTQSSFVLITFILLVDYLRTRHRTRRDALFMFGSIAVTIGATQLARLTNPDSRVLFTAAMIGILAQPYLLLRLVEAFRSVPRPAHRVALIGFVLTSALLAATRPPLAPGMTEVVVGYFVLVEGYAALLLLRAARATTGIMRRRLVLIGEASALLTASIFISGIAALLPEVRPFIRPGARLLALLSVIWYYLGFTPPARVRRTWQLAELHGFLRAIAGRSAEERVTRTFEDLCHASVRAVGALHGLALARDDGGSGLVVRASTVHGVPPGTSVQPDGPLATVVQDLKGMHVPTTTLPHPIGTMADRMGGRVAMAVPIASPETVWGVVSVFTRRDSLFPDDDLALLRLIAEQAAHSLALGALVMEERRLVAQLHRSTHELEAANKGLEAFSYSVSHDLRAPLRAIDGFSRILVEEFQASLPSEATRYLGMIRANAQQMGDLIDDLLTFSRLGRQPLRTRMVQPAALVELALEDLRPEQDGRTVDLQIGELPACEADPALLKQVFLNLLSNALKFTRHVDRARIEVGTMPRNGQLAYYVRDNGVGFDMRYAGKLFGVFQRLHRAEEYEGTGVGLAIVQRIVHRHGGDAWGEAELGRGATFYFTVGGSANGQPSR